MKKAVSFAVLAVLVAGQVEAAGRAGTNGGAAANANANVNVEAATSAANVNRVELAKKIGEYRKTIESSSVSKSLSRTQQNNLIRAMTLGNGSEEIATLVQKILADTNAANKELNDVTLVGLSNLGMMDQKSEVDKALQALGNTEAAGNKEALRVLFVNTLGGQARTWKRGPGSEFEGALAFAKSVNEKVTSGKTATVAIKEVIAEFQAAGFTKLNLEALKKLCGIKA